MSLNIEFLDNIDNYIKAKRYRLINSVLVYRDDEIICEKYYNKCDENSCHYVFCVDKVIASLTLGICIDKGWIKSVDEPICRYLPQFNKGKQPYHKLITIRSLITLSSGFSGQFNNTRHSIAKLNIPSSKRDSGFNSDDRLEHISDIQMVSLPGTKFKYGTLEKELLGDVILRACGMNEWHICHEYLYKPLKITNKNWDKWLLSHDPHGDPPQNMHNHQDSIYNLCARDAAKIGLLILHSGIWQGQRIISEEYIKAMSSPSAANSGYGLFCWLEDNRYLGLGWGGQELNISPDDNAVAVIQAAATEGNKFYRDICPNIFGDDLENRLQRFYF
jgi:CubicO group peptidase (beta-lactamase class C family)